ncbi:MAG TPA: hypothetical protein VNM69_01815 [Bacillus sp. (in: firmicutes)]|uniref:hypothetical protein n=1 Tax=Bacillus litorisediminis TaxID=2922713 RepID=UPI001FAE57FC|nr:hypothetical protein [Bacillus litorisediminis]HWO74635.1 hypothetical protein [Bacillus sp. (in: firmicutes)]
MIGLIIAIILFNIVAFATNKRLTINQIVHIWVFTGFFQGLADLYIDQKYHGYWYFSKDIEWASLLSITVLIPPVNMMFLNWYPFNASWLKKTLYFIYWLIFMLAYELIALLPEPWGYFNYGWWSLWYSLIVDPLLLFIVLSYYKWICKIEHNP